jgi:uncharacterized membrane protein YadS
VLFLGKLFGFNERMRYLLGFGSAICGAIGCVATNALPVPVGRAIAV